MLEQWEACQNCEVIVAVLLISAVLYLNFTFCFRDFDIGDTIQCLRYYAGWADKIVGQVRSPYVRCQLEEDPD